MDKVPTEDTPLSVRCLLERKRMEAACIMRCWHDEQFRADLLAHPKETLEREFGAKFTDLTFQVTEEKKGVWKLSLPLPRPDPEDDVSDEALDAVVGGASVQPASVATRPTPGMEEFIK